MLNTFDVITYRLSHATSRMITGKFYSMPIYLGFQHAECSMLKDELRTNMLNNILLNIIIYLSNSMLV